MGRRVRATIFLIRGSELTRPHSQPALLVDKEERIFGALTGQPDPKRDPTWADACARALDAVKSARDRVNVKEEARRGTTALTMGISMGMGSSASCFSSDH
jgi:hypothetical protein